MFCFRSNFYVARRSNKGPVLDNDLLTFPSKRADDEIFVAYVSDDFKTKKEIWRKYWIFFEKSVQNHAGSRGTAPMDPQKKPLVKKKFDNIFQHLKKMEKRKKIVWNVNISELNISEQTNFFEKISNLFFHLEIVWNVCLKKSYHRLFLRGGGLQIVN